MAEAVVNVRVADLEPFAVFIGEVARANDDFRSLSVEEAKALPSGAARGIATLQSALRALGMEDGAPEDDVVAGTAPEDHP